MQPGSVSFVTVVNTEFQFSGAIRSEKATAAVEQSGPGAGGGRYERGMLCFVGCNSGGGAGGGQEERIPGRRNPGTEHTVGSSLLDHYPKLELW